jgi:SSS family solute:Na+ symporter
VSVLTRPRPDGELRGLVWGLTPRITDDRLAWYLRPATLGVIVCTLLAALNILFR